MIKVQVSRKPKLSVVVYGTVHCKHELNLRTRGSSSPLFSATDVSFADLNADDEDPRLEVDVYPVGDQLEKHKGLVAFDWTIVVGKTAPSDWYEIIVSVVQGGAALFAKTYSSTDTDAGTGSGRVEMSIEVLDVC